MRLNTAIQCIVLLFCVHICSSTIIKRCQCVKLYKSVRNPSDITHIQMIKPRAYCKNTEVIITMSDQASLCLDPKAKFTKAIIQVWEISKQAARRKNTTSAKIVPAS